jgi:acetyl esterase/lipase
MGNERVHVNRILTVVAIWALSGFASAAESVRHLRGIVYTTHGKDKFVLDLAMPATQGPHPVVLCIHGGAWKYGDRTDLAWSPAGDLIVDELTKAGYATASIDYRLAPKHKFPAQIEDCKTAVRFLRANAEKYNLDKSRIAACGFSAGGHLAALLGTTDSSAGFDGALYPDESSGVHCVLDYFGPSDLSLYFPSAGLRETHMVPLLGKDAAHSLDVYKKASPITYVSKKTVPHLIVHGTFDLLVPVIHSERYRDKLKAEGVPVECFFMTGRMHGWSYEDSRISTAKGIEYLKKQMPVTKPRE